MPRMHEYVTKIKEAQTESYSQEKYLISKEIKILVKHLRFGFNFWFN